MFLIKKKKKKFYLNPRTNFGNNSKKIWQKNKKKKTKSIVEKKDSRINFCFLEVFFSKMFQTRMKYSLAHVRMTTKALYTHEIFSYTR